MLRFCNLCPSLFNYFIPLRLISADLFAIGVAIGL